VKARPQKVVGDELDTIGVERGTDASLSIGDQDTTVPQQQLDSFIERWKGDGTNALVMLGADVSSPRSSARSASTSTARTGCGPSTRSARSTKCRPSMPSLGAGKYDSDDTYGLVEFDPTVGSAGGDWNHLTPVKNVTGD
jgi:hypothetical protein